MSKEFRFSQQEILDLPKDPVLAEWMIRLKLKENGFDLDRINDIAFIRDTENNEYIYRQK
jgi:hypothetical protein